MKKSYPTLDELIPCRTGSTNSSSYSIGCALNASENIKLAKEAG